MDEHVTNTEPLSPSRKKLIWFGAIFALIFPTLITWGYFVYAERFSTSVEQSIYLVVKALQFGFPAAWVGLVLREPLLRERPGTQGLLLGAVFSAAVVGASWLVFTMFLRDTAVFQSAAEKIGGRLAQIGIDTAWKYAALGVSYALVHSLMEEYYWRWFAFGQLRRLVRVWPAILVSALAFMGHHVVVLGEFFHEMPWIAWLFSSAVAVGGVFWAWLYDRTDSLLGPWLSHLIIDAGIFWVGYELIGDSLSAGMAGG
jgi:membrane protease YdiL (CAAX protease family)